MLTKLFYIESQSQKKLWFAFHLFLGVLSTLSNLFLIVWFYYIFVRGIFIINKEQINTKKLRHIFHLLVYLTPFEILARMVQCTPIIPYELGKYLTFFLLLWAISLSNNSYKVGYLVVILCIPGILIGWPLAPDYRFIIFNIMGMINFGLGIAFFGSVSIREINISLVNVVRIMIYPLLTALVFAFLRTPDYDEMSFELGANFFASGGFGSNQVSTAFGLGMFLTFYLWYNKYSIFGLNHFVDLLISMFFFFQGLLTFSRGGIIGGALAIVILMFLGSNHLKSTQIRKVASFRTIIVVLPIITLVLFYANNLSKGNLFLRYQGETAGTLLGVKEKSLNTITTGRYEIFMGDIRIFKENPIFGVGVNASRYFRDYDNGVVAHVELSRLLAEHGFLGLIIFGIIIFTLIKSYRNIQYMSLLFLFAVIGFYTTFHAATRTFLSPLLMGLAMINVKPIRRRNPLNFVPNKLEDIIS